MLYIIKGRSKPVEGNEMEERGTAIAVRLSRKAPLTALIDDGATPLSIIPGIPRPEGGFACLRNVKETDITARPDEQIGERCGIKFESRSVSCKASLDSTPVQLNQVVLQALNLTQMCMERHWNNTTKRQLELMPLPAIAGSGYELSYALSNLISNAVDAMREGGTLTIRTRPVNRSSARGAFAAATHVVLEVVDTGTGMNEDTLSRCLKCGFTTKSGRAGLGLTMVSLSMQRHQADIEIASVLRQGTTVRLVFPVASAPIVNVAETERASTGMLGLPIRKARNGCAALMPDPKMPGISCDIVLIHDSSVTAGILPTCGTDTVLFKDDIAKVSESNCAAIQAEFAKITYAENLGNCKAAHQSVEPLNRTGAEIRNTFESFNSWLSLRGFQLPRNDEQTASAALDACDCLAQIVEPDALTLDQPVPYNFDYCVLCSGAIHDSAIGCTSAYFSASPRIPDVVMIVSQPMAGGRDKTVYFRNASQHCEVRLVPGAFAGKTYCSPYFASFEQSGIGKSWRDSLVVMCFSGVRQAMPFFAKPNDYPFPWTVALGTKSGGEKWNIRTGFLPNTPYCRRKRPKEAALFNESLFQFRCRSDHDSNQIIEQLSPIALPADTIEPLILKMLTSTVSRRSRQLRNQKLIARVPIASEPPQPNQAAMTKMRISSRPSIGQEQFPRRTRPIRANRNARSNYLQQTTSTGDLSLVPGRDSRERFPDAEAIWSTTRESNSEDGCLSEFELQLCVTGNYELLRTSLEHIHDHLNVCAVCREHHAMLQTAFGQFMSGVALNSKPRRLILSDA